MPLKRNAFLKYYIMREVMCITDCQIGQKLALRTVTYMVSLVMCVLYMLTRNHNHKHMNNYWH